MGSVFNRGTRDKPKWTAQWKENGRWRMVATKQTTKQKALRFLHLAEERVSQGRVGVEPDAPGTSFSAVAETWLKDHSKVACTSHDDNVSRMKHLNAAFGRLTLLEITPQRIDGFKAKMASETVEDVETGVETPRWKPNTINRVLALLRKILNDAVRWELLSHAPKVKLLPVPETDFDYLHRDEAERFLSHAREAAPNDAPLYSTAIYVGMRMGELYGLKWGDIDLDRGVMTVRRSYGQAFTKSKKIRRVRINRQLTIILKDWRRVCPPGDEELVFPQADGTARARERPPIGFEDLLKAARCHAITFHALRHTAASLMVMSGISLRAVQATLGHSTIAVTERYAHLSPSFQETEADRLSLDLQPGLGHVVALEGGDRG
jgi:integrase